MATHDINGIPHKPQGEKQATLVPLDPALSHCPLCESPKIRRCDIDHHELQVARCDGCGLEFMNPQCTDRYLVQYYSTYIRDEDLGIRLRSRNASKVDNFNVLLDHHRRRTTQPGRLLAVGCGDGYEVELAADLGWRAEGYDFDPQTTQKVSARIGKPVHSGDFTELAVADGTYDCIYLDQVLEHVKNPRPYLRQINHLLTDGGLVFIACPNMKSISNSFKTIVGKIGLKKTRGKHYCMVKHLLYFSPHDLAKVLQQQYGFKVLQVEGTPLAGQKSQTQSSWARRPLNWLRRKIPMLDSTFRIVARKVKSLPREHSAAA